MIQLPWFIRLGLLPFLASLCLFVLSPPACAQQQEFQIPGTGKTVPVCKPADLDTNVSFYHAPENVFIVAFDIQNTSARVCAPLPAIGPSTFNVEPGKQQTSFAVCSECDDRLPNGQHAVEPPVVLNPRETGHITFRWKTVAPSEAVKCLPLDALFGPALVVASPLLPQVCSQIAVSRTHAGAFVPPSSKGAPPAEEVQGAELFVISSSKPRYYQGEYFTLHVELVSPGAGAPSGEDCPVLFLREKSPDGSTRFDAAPPAGFRACKSFTWGADRNRDWQSGFEVDSGVNSRWGALGEHSLELFEPVGSSSDGKMQFARSNILTVHIADSTLIARKWGPKIKGVAVDVTLDKDTYKPGEDVPLHIAVENFDAPVPVYAVDPLWDPYPAISVEVRNSAGQPVPPSQRSSPGLWTGHGRGPVPYPPGKIVAMERSLADQGWLPKEPGTYTVFVTWATGTGPEPDTGSQFHFGIETKPYAVVQATAVFRIAANQPDSSR